MPHDRGVATAPVESAAGDHLAVSQERSILAAFGRVLISPFRTIVVHRHAIEIFVSHDVKARYINSVLGAWWAVVQPLSLLLLYTFVFSRIMSVRFGESASAGEFALYLFCGLLPWLAFSDAVTRSTSVIAEQTPLIKKVAFPSEILPVRVVLSALVVEFVGLTVLLCGITLWGRPPGWPLLVLPVVVVLQFLFTAGVAWILAALGVFIRDVRQAVGLALTLWMFLTPIVYPASLVPERFRWLLAVNPMTYIVEAYRGTVLDDRAPALVPLAVFAAIALAVFVSGHWAFIRSKHAFADML